MFHGGAVAALAPDDPDVASRLLGLVRKELVRPSRGMLPGDDAFRFRHLLIRDAAYDALPKAERAELHERFAAWLEEHAPGLVELDEIVGYHLEQAALYRAELGRPSPELATGQRTGSPPRACVPGSADDPNACVTLLTRASALFDDDDTRGSSLLPALGQALYWLGRLDDAYAAFDEAIEHADPDTAAYALFYATYIKGHGESTSPIDMERAIRAGLASVEGSASVRTLAAGHMTLGWALYWQGDLRGGIEEGEKAIELARLAGDRRVEWEALRLVGISKMHGDATWPEVERHADEMDAAGANSGTLRGYAAAMQGRLDEARRHYEEGVREQLEHGQLLNSLFQRLWYGHQCEALAAGDLDRAEEVLREGWERLGELGERGIRSTMGGCLGEVLARKGGSTKPRRCSTRPSRSARSTTG